MGRRTYEMLAGLPEPARDESWHRMSRLDKVVFSRTLRSADWPNTRICSTDLIAEIQKHEDRQRRSVAHDGQPVVARQLTDAGLVDRLRLMTFPLLAGESGREAAFADMVSTDLDWSIIGHWMAGSCS